MKVYGALARGEALAAGDPDWMNVTSYDDNTVTVTVQFEPEVRSFTYDRGDWEQAVAEENVSGLMDWDISDFDPTFTLFGPDGERVSW